MLVTMYKLIILAIVVALVVGLPTPDEKQKETKESAKVVRFCQPQTPCGWKIYNYIDYPEVYLNNDYCSCSAGQKCQQYEDRPHEGYVEYRCKLI